MFQAFKNLYIRGKIKKEGLAHAVKDKLITAADYQKITGEAYKG
jgi:hypothetical protein